MTTRSPLPTTEVTPMFLTPGTILAEGRVVEMTLTAYRVETPAGETVFVPFTKVHPRPAATPLVVFSAPWSA